MKMVFVEYLRAVNENSCALFCAVRVKLSYSVVTELNIEMSIILAWIIMFWLVRLERPPHGSQLTWSFKRGGL